MSVDLHQAKETVDEKQAEPVHNNHTTAREKVPVDLDPLESTQSDGHVDLEQVDFTHKEQSATIDREHLGQ